VVIDAIRRFPKEHSNIGRWEFPKRRRGVSPFQKVSPLQGECLPEIQPHPAQSEATASEGTPYQLRVPPWGFLYKKELVPLGGSVWEGVK